MSHKQKVLSLVERGGDVRSFRIVNLDVETIKPIVDANSLFTPTPWKATSQFSSAA